MEIHENDIGKEKRVFLVTLPKHNIENMQICVGDAYDEQGSLRYNIYNVDKKSKKVSSTIGYYEFPKEKQDLLDEEGDFRVLDLGEDAMHINYVKGITKPVKQAKSAASAAKLPEKLSKVKVKEYAPDADYYMADYFNKNYQLKDDDIIPTFLENMVKPNVWSNQSVFEAVAIFYNIFIVLVDDAIVNNNPGTVAVYPVLNGNYSPRKYVLISFETRNHFQLVENALNKTQFDLDELPEFLTDKFPDEHKQNRSGNSVSMPKYNLIETTENGDCFWDSVNRAVKGVANYDEEDITGMRKTVATAIATDENMEQVRTGIVEAYHLYTTKNNDSVYKLVFPDPTKENKAQFDDAFEYLFLKRDRVTHQLLSHVKNVRELSDEEQAKLIQEYLRSLEKKPAPEEKVELEVEVVNPVVEDLPKPEPAVKPTQKLIIKKPATVAAPAEAPAVTGEPSVQLPTAHTLESLNKLTIPQLKLLLPEGRKGQSEKKADIIDCILNPANCKQAKTKKNGGRQSNKYTRKL